jgi:signal transduction histidine kinase
MRRLLGVLREDDPDAASLAPAPGLAALGTLVEEAGHAGVRVALTVTGSERELPPGIDLAAYRIVQEALTNVAKHSGTDYAVVTVVYEPAALALDVTDRGIGGTTFAAGHGIAGMRERVAMYEGSFGAGPAAGGGFRVAARLPLERTLDW